MSKGFFDPHEPYETFKAKLQDVAQKMSRIADSTLQDCAPEWQATQKTHGNQSRSYKGWHQTGWGVSSTLALAVKLGVDPWQVSVSSQVTKETTK